jgi:hypothetical protein
MPAEEFLIRIILAIQFRDLFEDETQREVVIDCLQADCEVRPGRPAGL